MTSSTDSAKTEKLAHCPHRDAHVDDLLKSHGQECPIDLSVRCANDILADIRRLESESEHSHGHDKRLRAKFGGILERNLAYAYQCDRIEVFWTLDDAKSIEAYSGNSTSGRDKTISGAILELNAGYDSHSLLEKLVSFALGRSHVFSVSVHDGGPHLVVRPLHCLQSDKASPEWRIPIPLGSPPSLAGFLDELRQLPSAPEPDLHETIKGKIRKVIAKWVPSTWAAWPDVEFEAHLRDAGEREKASNHDFNKLFRDAAQHFALIAIYQAVNDYAAMSYILAPTMKGRSESALAVYWPRSIGEGSLNLLYLLQMVLGQNATTILGEQEKRRKYEQLAEARKMALGHLGHSLKNRLDTVISYLDKHGRQTLSGHMIMLSDVTDILQLNTVDDLEELKTLEKRDRFLDYADAESARPLDLKKLILHDWSALVAREQTYSGKGRRFSAWCRLDMRSRVNRAEVPYFLEDGDDRRCRVTATVYRELLFELLLNVRKYGYVRPCPDEQHDNLPVVSVRCDIGMAKVEDRKLLTLVNQVDPDKELPAHLQSMEWRRWPTARKYDGPGMALELFRRLEIGDMYYRSRTFVSGEAFFAVGLELIKLEIP